ncbi:hypothetical protein D6C84_07507 [Aureobasidium pullulans]|uniref:Uncharacterized protein n=1 Tax=Aureobasidium pullulans TaxID=5580 RepID=A0A4S9XQT8_AURPU|nr:hypothetical protein D6C84_07507 [Aureobasidium pullulans]
MAVSVYFLILLRHRANVRALMTECKNQSTEVRRNVDAGIASCVSGPRVAHVSLWVWFNVPLVKKARREAVSEEEHQVCDDSILKGISRCRPYPGVDASLSKTRVRLEIHILWLRMVPFITLAPRSRSGDREWFTTRRTGVISISDLREVVPVSENSLLLPGFRVLLNHVDAVTVGGADDTG